MWLAIAGTFAAATVVFHWYVSRKCKKPLSRNKIADDQQNQAPIYDTETIIQAKRALIVIAHPDDEAMFLAPTIIGLLATGTEVHLLCLSSGNYRRQGLQRKVELRNSCAVLGLPPSNITLVEHTKLPDDPYCLWNKAVIKEILLKYVHKLSIDAVITFDAYGVSGHVNHIAIYKACEHMHLKSAFPTGTRVYALQSVNVIRKYMGLADTVVSLFDGTSHRYISSYNEILTAQRAMFTYRSQLVWFRVLYIIFSRYMIVNTLRTLSHAPQVGTKPINDNDDDAEPLWSPKKNE